MIVDTQANTLIEAFPEYNEPRYDIFETTHLLTQSTDLLVAIKAYWNEEKFGEFDIGKIKSLEGKILNFASEKDTHSFYGFMIYGEGDDLRGLKLSFNYTSK